MVKKEMTMRELKECAGNREYLEDLELKRFVKYVMVSSNMMYSDSFKDLHIIKLIDIIENTTYSGQLVSSEGVGNYNEEFRFKSERYEIIVNYYSIDLTINFSDMFKDEAVTHRLISEITEYCKENKLNLILHSSEFIVKQKEKINWLTSQLEGGND